jgi:uncharacterized protein YdaU (DUF1376 family)
LKDLPYYKFFVSDFDEGVSARGMDYAEIGVYITCLNLAWKKDGLPADLNELARILKLSRKRFDKLWRRVGQCFSLADDGKLRNFRQESTRNDARSKRSKCSQAVEIREERRIERSSNDVSNDVSNGDPRARAGAYELCTINSSSEEELATEKNPAPREQSEPTGSLPQLVKATGTPPGPVVVPPKPTSLVDDFPEFRAVAESVGLVDSEPGWAEARLEWNRLDFQSKLAAISGLRIRHKAGKFDDPAYRPRPKNYIRNRTWECTIEQPRANRTRASPTEPQIWSDLPSWKGHTVTPE